MLTHPMDHYITHTRTSDFIGISHFYTCEGSIYKIAI